MCRERGVRALGPLVILVVGMAGGLYGQAKVEVLSSERIVERGAPLKVEVVLSGMGANSYCNNGAFLKFDQERTGLVGQEKGEAVSVFVPDSRGLDTIRASGELRVGGTCDLSGGVVDNKSGDGVLARFSFEAKVYGKASFSSESKAVNPFGMAMITATGQTVLPDVGGVQEISVTGPGDADGSGQVGIPDLLGLAELLNVAAPDARYKARLDMNRDGVINEADIQLAAEVLRTIYFK